MKVWQWPVFRNENYKKVSVEKGKQKSFWESDAVVEETLLVCRDNHGVMSGKEGQ